MSSDLPLDFQPLVSLGNTQEKRHRLEIDSTAKFNKRESGWQPILVARMGGRLIYRHRAELFFEKRKDALLIAKQLAKDGVRDIERMVRDE